MNELEAIELRSAQRRLLTAWIFGLLQPEEFTTLCSFLPSFVHDRSSMAQLYNLFPQENVQALALVRGMGGVGPLIIAAYFLAKHGSEELPSDFETITTPSALTSLTALGAGAGMSAVWRYVMDRVKRDVLSKPSSSTPRLTFTDLIRYTAVSENLLVEGSESAGLLTGSSQLLLPAP